MKLRLNSMRARVILLLLCAFAVSDMVQAQDKPGKICPDPRRPQPCSDSGSYNLPFLLPNDGIARAEFKSDLFYAVILKTVERCGIKESERLAPQQLFPSNKVFTSRFECEDYPENNIKYMNVDDRYGFLAVYAGATPIEAQKFLAKVKATGQFHGANIRRLQAVLVYP